MNPRPKQEPALGSPDKKDPTERTKIIIMSSYKDQTTRETKKFQQKEQKGKNLEDIQTNKNNPNKKDTNVEPAYLRRWDMDQRHYRHRTITRNSLWNQNKYQVGTWIEPKLQQSLSRRIVDKLPHFKSFPSIIQTSIGSSLSSLNKKKKKLEK